MKVEIAFQLDWDKPEDNQVLICARSLIHYVYRYIRLREYRTALIAASELHMLPSDVAVLTHTSYEKAFDENVASINGMGMVCKNHFDNVCSRECNLGKITAEEWVRWRMNNIRTYLSCSDGGSYVRLEYDAYVMRCHEELIAVAKEHGALKHDVWVTKMSAYRVMRAKFPGYATVMDNVDQKDIAAEVDKLNEKYNGRGKVSAAWADRYNVFNIVWVRQTIEFLKNL